MDLRGDFTFKRVIIWRVGPLFWLLDRMARSRLSIVISGAVILVLFAAGFFHVTKVNKYSRDFERTNLGFTEAEVINLMGKPDHRELRGEFYPRYADRACIHNCNLRLWWEAPMLPGIEAWSVEFNSAGVATDKAHWVSP